MNSAFVVRPDERPSGVLVFDVKRVERVVNRLFDVQRHGVLIECFRGVGGDVVHDGQRGLVQVLQRTGHVADVRVSVQEFLDVLRLHAQDRCET